MISVLVPTDFSKNAYNAMRYAISMMKKEMIHIVLLNTYQILPSTTEMFISIEDILKLNSEKGLKSEIEQLKKEFPNANFTYDLVSLYGNLKNGINEIIKNQTIDLVVMGTSGATGLQKLFLGSNASDIIRSIGKPVLIIPENEEISQFNNIVLAIDYKQRVDTKMMNSLKLVAGMNNAFINIVSIVSKNEIEKIKASFDKSKVCDALKEFPHDYELIEGENVVESINLFIKEKKANMLAIIPQRLSLFESFFHKSISKELVMRAEIPMMAMN